MRRHDLKVEHVPIRTLRSNPDNPRAHSRKQVRQLAKSIRRFGFTAPPLVGEAGLVIAGHGRLEAAAFLDIDTVPIIRLQDLSEAEQRALMTADNRLAENSEWDQNLLKQVLQGLVDLDFELEDIGFDTADVDLHLGNGNDGLVVDEADTVEEADRERPPKHDPETSSYLANTGCSAPTHESQPATNGCSAVGKPAWSSPIHLTTCQSSAM